MAGAIMFTLSPVHTDGYYADKADKLSASPDIDTLLLYTDTGGVLDRGPHAHAGARGIANARGKPIEFHRAMPKPSAARFFHRSCACAVCRSDPHAQPW